MANTGCLVCDGTGAVARDGGFDACPMCSGRDSDAVPEPVDEELTALVEDESMADLVSGPNVDWTGQCDDFMRSTP